MDALTLHCEMQDTSPLQEDDFKLVLPTVRYLTGQSGISAICPV